MSTTLERRPDELARSIVSPRSYAELNTLLANFAWLRANDPVSLIETENFDPFWAARVSRSSPAGRTSYARWCIWTTRTT